MDNDLISRSALKKAIADLVVGGEERIKEVGEGRDWINGIHSAYREIDNAPTVEQPQGEWIDYSNEGYVECPFCGSATNCEDNKDELHYCFHCGAKMKQD